VDQEIVTLTLNDVSPGEPPAAPIGQAGGDGPRAGQPVRRTFTAAYKLRIVEEYFSLTEHGARGALLRREGLYQSHLEKCRRALDRGRLASTPERPRVAPAGQEIAPSAAERRLLAENARLESELAKAKAVLAVVGKAHALLEILSESAEEQPRRR
jgi:transposase-like protein